MTIELLYILWYLVFSKQCLLHFLKSKCIKNELLDKKFPPKNSLFCPSNSVEWIRYEIRILRPTIWSFLQVWTFIFYSFGEKWILNFFYYEKIFPFNINCFPKKTCIAFKLFFLRPEHYIKISTGYLFRFQLSWHQSRIWIKYVILNGNYKTLRDIGLKFYAVFGT